MSGLSAFPYPGSSIVVEAAQAASSELKRAKASSGRAFATSRANEERLRRRSRKMAKDFQDKMEQNVRRKLNNMSGPDDNRKRGMKVAQFIPGKGLEVQGAQQHKDSTIYCSLGEKSDKLVDPLAETFKTMSGKKVSIDFAFKLVNEPNLRQLNKTSRVTALNCFRHVNPDSFNYQKTGQYVSPVNDVQKTANLNWHTTLGPDAAYVRRGTDGLSTAGFSAGVWRTASNDTKSVGGFAQHWDGTAWVAHGDNEAGLANSLISPYRTPSDFEAMYSRINRQVLENYGFSLNSFKFQSPGTSSTANSVPVKDYVRVWASPNEALMNFGETANTSEDALRSSIPAKINTEIPNQASESDQSTYFNQYLEYHSQLGSGKLNYQFSNDGTNPVCIDICVVGVKKGQTVPVAILENLCSFNYGINKYANQHYLNVNGYQGNVDSDQGNVDWDFANKEWHTDAKLPFMPDECFKNPQSYLDATGYSDLASGDYLGLIEAFNQGKKNPFKVVKRDQFIVSSGATRAWNTTLPSIKYRPQLYENVEYPLSTGLSSAQEKQMVTTADEYTYILCIGAHGLSTPVEELYPSQTTDPDGTVREESEGVGYEVLKKAIIDHEATSCSVSVVGTYTELVKPAFPKDVSDRSFINGRLMLPHFAAANPAGSRIKDTENTEYPTRLSSVDISTQGQIVRTTDSGITGVGAINPSVGA